MIAPRLLPAALILASGLFGFGPLPSSGAPQPNTSVALAQPTVVTVSGYGRTREEAHIAALQAARQTAPAFQVKKETFERTEDGWVDTMEIWVQ